MAQVRRHTRNPSPPPRQIPSLPDALRLPPTLSRNTRRTHSFQTNNRPPYPGSPIRATYQQQFIDHSHPPLSQTHAFYNTKYDSLTGSFTNTSTTNKNNHENYTQPYIISSPIIPREPLVPSSKDLFSFQSQQYERPKLNNHEVRAI
jgi:hypothetical protein